LSDHIDASIPRVHRVIDADYVIVLDIGAGYRTGGLHTDGVWKASVIVGVKRLRKARTTSRP
jgi:hypothetical protein